MRRVAENCALWSRKNRSIMNRNLQYIIFCISLLCLVAVGDAMAQVSHISTVNPLTGAPYEKVYDYDFVDEKPQFPGGDRGLFNYINDTREYPYEAYHNGVEGRVFCTFIINPDGRVSDISIVRGAGDEQLNREAVRVISVMPKWKAGKVNHKAVPVRCYLPIAFML